MSENLNNWLGASELNFAYYDFTDPYQRQKFNKATAPGPMLAYKMLMCADLFAQLSGGKLKAWGFCVEPAPSDGPVPIPVHCFMQRPNVEECDNDIISASGWRYERVRVAIAENENNSAIVVCGAAPAESKVGRPSTYPAVKAALEQIRATDPAKIQWTAERLLDDFNQIYAEYASDFGLRSLKLGERAFRDHLRRFRQETAEIGKNDNAN